MVEYLRRGRYDLEQLALEFNVTTRTVRRDLEALSIAGVQVRHLKQSPEFEQRGLWWVDQQRWTSHERSTLR